MTDLKSHLTSFGNASSVVPPILLAGGWTHESVFKCPAGILADWFRDRNEEVIADALAEPVGTLIWSLRDAAYEGAPVRQSMAIQKYAREYVAEMKKVIGNDLIKKADV